MIMVTALWCLLIGITYARPNFIIIYPDNQELSTATVETMPTLHSLIAHQGVNISNGFVTTPVCCPSRAELLTGRYFHNQDNFPNGDCMHVESNLVFSDNSLFQIMYNNGYHVGAFGKIMNNMKYWCGNTTGVGPSPYYCDTNTHVNVKGFSRLYIPCNYLDYWGHCYFNKFENNSYRFSHIDNSHYFEGLYQTSQIGNSTIEWIDELYSNNNKEDISFFALWGVHAPHEPATPASEYTDRFPNHKAPEGPNFNLYSPDKHWMVSVEPELNGAAKEYIHQHFKNKLRSMLSVDDFIYTLYETLDKWDIADNTYVIYVSDHGMHLGQWRIPSSYLQIYDTDIRVPFYIRGPDIIPNSTIDKMISNVDIAPTIYELAGLDIDPNEYNIDGESFAKYLNNGYNDNDWRDTLLFEYVYNNNRTLMAYPVWYENPQTIPLWANHSVENPLFNNHSYTGIVGKPPCCNAAGERYWTDNYWSGTWRGLRIINDSMDITYAEYINGDWNAEKWNDIKFYEYYNNTNDYYQIYNIYDQLDEETKQYLHQVLANYANCKTTECWSSITSTTANPVEITDNNRWQWWVWLLIVLIVVAILIAFTILFVCRCNNIINHTPLQQESDDGEQHNLID